MGTLNCRSIVNKRTIVLEHLKDYDIDICLIQETFLSDKDSATLAEIKEIWLGSYIRSQKAS